MTFIRVVLAAGLLLGVATRAHAATYTVTGTIKTPNTATNPLANDVPVSHIRVIVMVDDPILAPREVKSGYTNALGDFSISFDDNSSLYGVFVDVEYIAEGFNSHFIKVSTVANNIAWRDSHVSATLFAPVIGDISLGTLHVSSTIANLVTQAYDA